MGIFKFLNNLSKKIDQKIIKIPNDDEQNIKIDFTKEQLDQIVSFMKEKYSKEVIYA